MATISDNILLTCLKHLLRPAIRFCLRRSLSIQDVVESTKIVFIEMAAEDMRSAKQKVNVSRLSATTGIRRKEVTRIYRDADIKEPSHAGFSNRVIGQWRHDKRYLDKSSRPKVLSYKGSDSEFSRLVAQVSTDVPPLAVLQHLERSGAVEKTSKGLKLKALAYKTTKSSAESYQYLGDDVEDLVSAVLDNFDSDPDKLPNYHARTYFDNISQRDLEKIRDWLYRECSRLQLKAEKYISNFDLDLHPELSDKSEGGAEVSVGIFTKTEPL